MTARSDDRQTPAVLFVSVPESLTHTWTTLFRQILAESFRSAQDALRSESVADLAAATARLSDGTFHPDFVLVYQGVPDQFRKADVESFIGLIPLSRCLVAFGPWCESIGRTEPHWPAAWCVPVSDAAARLRREIPAWRQQVPPVPATASRDEAFVESTLQTLNAASRPLQGMTVAISSLDSQFGDYLAAVTSSFGGRPVRGPFEPPTADIELVAATLIGESTLATVRQRRAHNPSAKLFAVTDMATPNDRRNLLASGCDGVLSQLRFIEQFVHAIHDPAAQPVDDTAAQSQ